MNKDKISKKKARGARGWKGYCLVHLEKGMWLGVLLKQKKKKGSQLLGDDIRLLKQKTESDDGL